MDYISEKLTLQFPRLILVVSSSFSGKSERLKNVLINSEKFFCDLTEESNIIIVTDTLSKESWVNCAENDIKIKTDVFDYQEIIKSPDPIYNIRKNSIIVFDDLTSQQYLKIKEIVDYVTDVLTHHKNAITWILTQQILGNHLTHLLTKANELHTSLLNRSSYKLINYVATYNFHSNQRTILRNSLLVANKYKSKRDTFIVINLKENFKRDGNYLVAINKFGHVYDKKDLCVVLSDEDRSWIQFDYVKKQVGFYDLSNRGFIYSSDIKLLTSIFEGIRNKSLEEMEDHEEYVLFPKKFYDFIVSEIKLRNDEAANQQENNENDSKNVDFSRHVILKDNLLNLIKQTFQPKKINPTSKLANEMLINSNLSFIGLSGRVFIINNLDNCDTKNIEFLKKHKMDPLCTKIKTIEFLSEVCKKNPPFIKSNLKKLKKTCDYYLYASVINILLSNNTAKILILNSNYLL